MQSPKRIELFAGRGCELIRPIRYGRAPSMKPLELTILIVDDWPDAAESLGIVLGLNGHTIHIAHDGVEAMGKAKRYKPDVVLLDIAMPRMTGLDLARILSERDAKRPLLVAVSGFGSNEDKARAYEAGFDHYFTKPINPTDVLLFLEEKEKYFLAAKRELVCA